MMQSSLYTVGGTILPDQGIYIERQADSDLLAACRAMEYAYVLTARQLGKSSLMVRTAASLREEGVAPIILDLNELGVQATMQEWYLGLMFRIASTLGLQANLLGWWREHEEVGVTQRLTLFFEELILPATDKRLVIFIDEIDTTLSLPFTDDFFAAIRYLYNARSTNSDLKRLAFVLIGVATPSDLIDDPKRTPFNIGRRIDLTDFTRTEADPFLTALPATNGAKLLNEIIDWTGGHPYLTQRLAAATSAAENPNVNHIVRDIFLGENSDKDNNLQFVRDMLTKRAPAGYERELLTTYQNIRLGRQRVRDEEQSVVKNHLKLAGIVKRDAKNNLTTRNKIYTTVFDRRWLRNQWPVSWLELIPFEVKAAVAASFILLLGLIAALAFGLNQQRTAVGLGENLATEVVVRATAEQQAIANANLAATRAAESENNADLAATRAVESENNAALAATRAVESEENAALAATRAVESAENEAIAIQNLAVAESRRLASEAQLAIERDPQAALLLAIAGLNSAETTAARQALHAALNAPYRIDLLHTLDIGNWTSPNKPFEFSPNGRSLLVVNGADGKVTIWDVATGEVRVELPHEGYVSSAEWLQTTWADENQIITSAEDGVRIWDGVSDEGITYFESAALTHVSANDDGILISAFDGPLVRLFDMTTGATLREVALPDIALSASIHNGRIAAVTLAGVVLFDADDTQLAAAGQESDVFWEALWNPDGTLLLVHQPGSGTVTLWDAATGETVQQFVAATPFSDVIWHVGGAQVLTFGNDNRLVAWDVVSGESTTLQAISADVGGLSGDTLLTYQNFENVDVNGEASGNGRFFLRSAENADLLTTVEQPFQVWGIERSPDEQIIAAADREGNAALWQRAGASPLEWFKTDSAIVSITAAEQETLLIEDVSGKLTTFDVASRQPLATYAQGDGVGTTRWSADKTRYLSADGLGNLFVIDAQTGEIRQTLRHPDVVFFAVWLADDQQIASSAADGTLRLWDVATGERVWETVGVQGFSVELDETGEVLLVASFEGDVQRISIQSGELLQRFALSQPGQVVRWLAGNQTLVSVSGTWLESQNTNPQTTLDFWTIEDETQPFNSVTLPARATLQLNQDRTQLLFASFGDAAGTFVVLDAQGNELMRGEHPDGTAQTAWHADGERFLTVGTDGEVRVWSVENQEILATLVLNRSIVEALWVGETLLLGSADGQVVEEFIDIQQLINRACTVSYRPPTEQERRRIDPFSNIPCQ